MNNSWIKPIIFKKDVEKVRESVKIGDKFIYKTLYKDVGDKTVRPKLEEVVVIKKYPHVVQLVNPKRPDRIRSMTYIEILFQKRGLTGGNRNEQ